MAATQSRISPNLFVMVLVASSALVVIPTDIDRDGDTGIQDLLTLLGGWGACR